MEEPKDLVAIPWKERWLQDRVSFPALGGTCYVVISEKYFGWRPSPWHMMFFPGKYFVIPIDSIKSAEFKGNWLEQSVHIVTILDDPALQVIEGDIQFPYVWLQAFDVLEIPVVNRELASLRNLKGFLASFHSFIYVVVIAFLFGICVIVAVRMNAPREVALMMSVLAVPVAGILWLEV
jgi:hypothetical protein